MTTVRTALSALLLCLSASCLLSCQRKPLTSFERQNREARWQNPAGLKFELRTSDSRTTYHLFEPIPLDLAFSSSAVATYSIELDDEMNTASLSDKFLADPVDSLSSTIPSWLRAFVCCGSNPQYLSSGPTVLQEDLTDIFRFEKPGRYEIYATTQRIFRGKDASMEEDYGPSKFTVTSNILALTILPDDPKWDSHQLADALRILRDPRAQADYAKAQKEALDANPEVPAFDATALHEVYQTKFAQAQRALNTIDSPAAIQERVSLMNLVPAKDRQHNTSLFQPLLRSSTRPDLIVSAMESRADDPSFGVDLAFSYYWTEYTIRRDHPDLFRLSSDEIDPGKKRQAFQLSWTASQKYEIQFLERALKSKKGEARSTTTSTIGHLKEEIAPAKRNNTKH